MRGSVALNETDAARLLSLGVDNRDMAVSNRSDICEYI